MTSQGGLAGAFRGSEETLPHPVGYREPGALGSRFDQGVLVAGQADAADEGAWVIESGPAGARCHAVTIAATESFGNPLTRRDFRGHNKSMNTTQTADLKWLKNAEHWQQFERFDEVTGEREEIFLLKSKSGPKARFYARGKGQVGPQHQYVMNAMCWAYANGYLGVVDPFDVQAVLLQLGCRAEVLAGGAPKMVTT